MASDTFAEVVEWLDGIAQFERIQTQSPWASPPERALHEAKAQQYAKAARLLAAAGEYAKQTHRLIADSGLPTKTYKAELRAVPQGIDMQDTLNDWCNARSALDQLAPELKEIA